MDNPQDSDNTQSFSNEKTVDGSSTLDDKEMLDSFRGEEEITSTEAKKIQKFDQSASPRFGCYQLLSELEQGGMGKVYKVYDPDLQRTVAVKVLLTDKASRSQISCFLS